MHFNIFNWDKTYTITKAEGKNFTLPLQDVAKGGHPFLTSTRRGGREGGPDKADCYGRGMERISRIWTSTNNKCSKNIQQ